MIQALPSSSYSTWLLFVILTPFRPGIPSPRYDVTTRTDILITLHLYLRFIHFVCRLMSFIVAIYRWIHVFIWFDIEYGLPSRTMESVKSWERTKTTINKTYALRYNTAFRPLSPLHILNGGDANGIWTLNVADTTYSNRSDALGGILHKWGISFQ